MNALSHKLKQSLSLSFLDKYVGYCLRFLSTVILARLVTPDDIGVFSVAFVMIGLGHLLRDFGVAQYLIKENEVDVKKIRAAFSVMLYMSCCLFLSVYVFREQIAHFYSDPRVFDALTTLSFIFLIAPFGSVRIALLRRKMNFKALAKINILSYGVSHFVTLLFAFSGWGFMALVWGQLAGALATLVGTLMFGPSIGWHWPALRGLRSVLKFGINISGANIGEHVADGSPDLILGRMYSMEAVGFFGRAMGCVNLFKLGVNAAVWPVVLPYFSTKTRAGEKILEDYLKGISFYTVFGWPFFMALGILAFPCVLVLYGHQWGPAVPLLQIICLAAFFEALFPFRTPLLVALGLERLNLKTQIQISVLKVSFIFIGACFSLKSAAIAWVCAEGLACGFVYRVLVKNLNLTFHALWSSVSKSFGVMLCVGGWSMGLMQWMPFEDKLIFSVMISGFSVFVVWAIVVYGINHPLKVVMSKWGCQGARKLKMTLRRG